MVYKFSGMKRISIGLALIGVCLVGKAQENADSSLGESINNLTYRWDKEAEKLSTYDGLITFCDEESYRFEIISLLNDIHHFDSVLYQRLVKAQRFNHDKEIEKTLEDIREFEDHYAMKDLIHFLHQECLEKGKIEKNAKELKNDIGENSYDGQIYLIEVELNKYIKHITKKVDIIRKHVQHLHIE